MYDFPIALSMRSADEAFQIPGDFLSILSEIERNYLWALYLLVVHMHM